MFGLPSAYEWISLIMILTILSAYMFYLKKLDSTIALCRPEIRSIEPGQVWLLLIPYINIAWHCILVVRLSKTIKEEFKMRGKILDKENSKLIGLAIPASACLAIFIQVFLISTLLFWLLYWRKISEYYNILSYSEL